MGLFTEYVQDTIAEATKVITEQRERIAKLEAVCRKLDELDWCIGYELGPDNMDILDEALTQARALIKDNDEKA